MSAVDGFSFSLLEWLASYVRGTLSDSVVAITELELDNISNACSDQVRYKERLGTANHHRDHSVRSSLYGTISPDYLVVMSV